MKPPTGPIQIVIALRAIFGGSIVQRMLSSLRDITLGLTLTVFSVANAQNVCAQYLERTVEPLKPDVLWRQLSSVPTTKDEYETTLSFEARVANAIGRIADPVVVEIPVRREYIVYDADTNRLNIQSYAFANERTNYSGVFGYGTPPYGKIKYGSSNIIDVVLPSEETRVGSYVGTTALGVKIRVTQLKRLTRTIFEREGKASESLFFERTPHETSVMSFGDVTPELARHVKATARAAIVYSPVPPYFAKGKYPWGSPTVDGPTDIDETIEVAIGDIQCVLFLNAAAKVYGAVATR